MAMSEYGIPSTPAAIEPLSNALRRAEVPPARIVREKSLGKCSPLDFKYSNKIDVAPPRRLVTPSRAPLRSAIFLYDLPPTRIYGAALSTPAITFRLAPFSFTKMTPSEFKVAKCISPVSKA